MKNCTTCKESLSMDAFGTDKHQSDGKNTRCKTCIAASAKKRYYDSNQQRNFKYLKRYGITLEEVEQMATTQNYKCPICDQPCRFKANNGADAFVVDHCHSTGKVRGLICSRCNRSMGFMGDNPDLLRRAADYLEAECQPSMLTGVSLSGD